MIERNEELLFGVEALPYSEGFKSAVDRRRLARGTRRLPPLGRKDRGSPFPQLFKKSAPHNDEEAEASHEHRTVEPIDRLLVGGVHALPILDPGDVGGDVGGNIGGDVGGDVGLEAAVVVEAIGEEQREPNESWQPEHTRVHRDPRKIERELCARIAVNGEERRAAQRQHARAALNEEAVSDPGHLVVIMDVHELEHPSTQLELGQIHTRATLGHGRLEHRLQQPLARGRLERREDGRACHAVLCEDALQIPEAKLAMLRLLLETREALRLPQSLPVRP